MRCKKLFSGILVCAIILSMSTSSFAMSVKDAAKQNSQIKNIIVMIPDGMSVDGVTLARWYKSYDATSGKIDTSVTLALDEMASGLVRTYWKSGDTVGAITDSAPAATAFASGIKTDDKHVGVTPSDAPVATIIEAAKQKGKATGVIATSNVQHATPADFTAHNLDRSKYDILGEQQVYNNLDVMMGGGSTYLASPYRKDSENLVNTIKDLGFNYVTTKDEMNSVYNGRLWGMFAADAMAYDLDTTENAITQPTLSEMTSKAIQLLSINKNGFFLMVEGSKVDWAAHANDPVALITDILAFDKAVKVALDYAKLNQNTMVLVMTDHGNGGITIGNKETDASYSKEPVTKFIAPLKKATLTGEGIEKKLNAERTNIKEVMSTYYGISDITAEEEAAIKGTKTGSMNYTVGPMLSKRAYLGWTTTGHTGEDITLYTYMPKDERITGTIDNTDIAKICSGVWGINLESMTKQLYNDVGAYFTAKGATVETDISIQSGGRMTVTKGSTTLLLMENKNYILLNGSKYELNSVIINQNGKFYAPSFVLELIK